MLTFQQCETRLGSKDRVKLKNNTVLVRLDADRFGVTLHSTVVVEVRRDGSYKLDSGGWLTVTTKARMNEFSPARVYQKKHAWFVGDEPYHDGIVVR